jgi:phosphoribosylglycinamide formyltransferase-1
MKKVAFLCSGNGGNLKFLDKTIKNGWLPDFQIASVITDRECAAGKYAQENGIASECIDFSESHQQTLTEKLTLYEPDVILTTVHRILNDNVLKVSSGNFFNLHYSLLPSFSGKIGSTTVQAALDYGVCLIGATVHHVNETVDGGKPCVQVALPVYLGDALVDLMNIEFRAGCIALLIAMTSLNWKPKEQSSMQLQILGRDALVNPGMPLPHGLWSEAFWSSLR